MQSRARRRATSPAEVAQIQRVNAWLEDVALGPGKTIVVTTANGERHEGKLVSHYSGSRLAKGRRTGRDQPWYYGSIELATPKGKTEIDYLDIVWIGPEQSRLS